MVSDQPKVVVVQRDCLQNTSVTIRKKKYINKKCGIVCEIFRKGGGGRLISTRRWNRGGKRGRRICNSAWNNRRNARVVNQLPLWRVRISWQRPRDPGSSQDLWIVFECARSCTLRKARNARSSEGTREEGPRQLGSSWKGVAIGEYQSNCEKLFQRVWVIWIWWIFDG